LKNHIDEALYSDTFIAQSVSLLYTGFLK